ncbi:MAG: OmpH family outer membrane protein [Bacteroidaceae bacterium]|nr:OmpH family outer membrane protein [Bacteroidaceae bacterium]
MKKLILLASAFMLMISCGKNAGNEEAEKEIPATPNSGLRVAFVEVDSLMTQYQFCKDYSDVLANEYANIQKELAGKQRALQQSAATVQKNYETAVYKTQDDLQRAQAGLARQEQDLAALSDRLSSEFANSQAAYNEEMRDSIQAFLKDYNKGKKFDYILSKGGDNMLYANPAYDITEDVINGLNKRYKVKPEIAEKLKNAKKNEEAK